MKPRTLLASLVSLAAIACGGSQSTAPSTAAAEQAQPAPPPADMAFDDMSMKQRASFMKHVVLPEMTTLFTSLDPKYKDMNCATCHGKGAEDHTFKMPNPDLPKLPSTEAGFAKLQQEKGKVLAFMATQVKPKMAALLKQTEFDPATKTGDFGCQNCHTFEEAPAP